ncbi:MAG: hypothetical protein AB7S50_05595 [Bacteroidales bacterium]
MNIFFKNILSDKSTNPPEPVKNHFFSFFTNPFNIDWHSEDDFYEAIFYEDDLEKIAKYDTEGNFINVKTNIPVDHLPQKVFLVAQSFGEIMNAILISNFSETFYEIILRDKELVRFELFLDENGTVISNQKL